MPLKKDDMIQILNQLDTMFPNAGCELKYENLYQLLIAVVLSAQTTDKAVNGVSAQLFKKFPNVYSLASSQIDEVEPYIKRIGLARTKSKNIINLSKKIVNDFNGNIPNTLEDLMSLPGVGRKTANVVLSEGFKIQRIAVDTHVERVSKRLGVCDINSSVLGVEEELMKIVPSDNYHHAHHLLLFFGRYFCTAKKPQCFKCPFVKKCVKEDKNLQE